jgi:hypothetical protein
LFAEWVVAATSIPSHETAWLKAHLRCKADVDLPFYENDSMTLGQYIMSKTANILTLEYLIQVLGVNPGPHIVQIVDRCIISNHPFHRWSRLVAYAQPPVSPASFSVHPTGGPFVWTPLGRAIFLGQTDAVRFLLEYGCTLPLAEDLPAWAWDLQTRVFRKKQCTKAALALLTVGRRQRDWRNLAPLFARALWELKYRNDWDHTPLEYEEVFY